MPDRPSTSADGRPGVVLHNEDVAPAALLEGWLRERAMPDDPRRRLAGRRYFFTSLT
jgi:hypothetical protein